MTTKIDVQEDITYLNSYFKRFFRILYAIVILFLIFFTWNTLREKPSLMHDWRGFTCIALSLVIPLCYGAPFVFPNRRWPPPLYYSLGIWGSMYLVTTALSLIDANFLWDFYIVFGVSFSVFRSYRLFLAVTIVAITMFAFQGLLAWPLPVDNLSAIIGQGMGMFSMTGFSILMQRLLSERFERNRLVQQLTQANAQLEEAHNRLTQSVEQEQELAVLRERTRLAREMHDTLGHALVLIAVKLEAAQRLRERDPERCDRELESTKEVARDSMTALRASIANLRSPALEHEHVYRALARITRDLAHRTGLHVTHTLQADIENLPEPVSETLWKVCLEALTNIEKHAHASRVELRVGRDGERVLMSIHDDGIGLPHELYQSNEDGSVTRVFATGHYGLRGMLERVENIGGHLSVCSDQEQGTTITVTLPLSPQFPTAVDISVSPNEFFEKESDFVGKTLMT